MEGLCTPVIATAAMFTAIVLLDILRHEFEYVPRHGFFGFLCILLVSILCQYGATIVAWCLLALPFLLLIIVSIIQAAAPKKSRVSPSRAAMVTPSVPAPTM